MVFWFDIDTSQIETVTTVKDKTRFRYKGGPLRFQVPRGLCTWGVNGYKSFQVSVSDPDFIQWWRALETQLCPLTPFNSNLRDSSLRIKIDDSVYVFDQNSKQINPDVKEGLFRGQELSCLIDVDSTYFYNENWGLTIRAYQVKTLTDAPTYLGSPAEETPAEETPAEETPVALTPGVCAFLPIS